MRRADREISDKATLIEILDVAEVCRIALQTGKAPYIVPLNFGYAWEEKLVIYFHCAKAGRKLDLIKLNDLVGFEIDTGYKLITGDNACDWGMKYKSIIGVGKISQIDDEARKERALHQIMKHYNFMGMPEYKKEVFKNTVVLGMTVEEISGKENK